MNLLPRLPTSIVLEEGSFDDPDNAEESELEKMDISQTESKIHQMSFEESFKRKLGAQHNLLVKCLLNFICVDKRPFDTVNGRGFRRFLKQLSPSFKIPTVYTLNRLDDTYDALVNVYKTKFGSDEVGHGALTSDVWSEIMSSRSFIGITAHFLEAGIIKSRCIVTKELEDRHTSVYISEKLEEICQQFGINKDKIPCIVTDSGTSMVAAIKHFLGKESHPRCFAHTFNLVVENVTNQDTVLLVTNKIREI
ncbi:unnamed protein product, partial [Timema podura]|nr:unnamed protein product [Timema podura]